MKMNPPKKITFYIAVALAVVGLIFYFLPAAAAFAFWVLLIAFAVLVASLVVKGM